MSTHFAAAFARSSVSEPFSMDLRMEPERPRIKPAERGGEEKRRKKDEKKMQGWNFINEKGMNWNGLQWPECARYVSYYTLCAARH